MSFSLRNILRSNMSALGAVLPAMTTAFASGNVAVNSAAQRIAHDGLVGSRRVPKSPQHRSLVGNHLISHT